PVYSLNRQRLATRRPRNWATANNAASEVQVLRVRNDEHARPTFHDRQARHVDLDVVGEPAPAPRVIQEGVGQLPWRLGARRDVAEVLAFAVTHVLRVDCFQRRTQGFRGLDSLQPLFRRVVVQGTPLGRHGCFLRRCGWLRDAAPNAACHPAVRPDRGSIRPAHEVGVVVLHFDIIQIDRLELWRRNMDDRHDSALLVLQVLPHFQRAGIHPSLPVDGKEAVAGRRFDPQVTSDQLHYRVVTAVLDRADRPLDRVPIPVLAGRWRLPSLRWFNLGDGCDHPAFQMEAHADGEVFGIDDTPVAKYEPLVSLKAVAYPPGTEAVPESVIDADSHFRLRR